MMRSRFLWLAAAIMSSHVFVLTDAQDEDENEAATATNNDATNVIRTARPMTLDFCRTLIYTAVGHGDGGEINDVNGQKHSNFTARDWEIFTENAWRSAVFIEQNESSPFPFIICDDGQGDLSVERKRDVVADAIGVENENVQKHFETIYNTPEVSCYIGLINGTRAADLDEFIVQPVSFLLKINAGSLGFTEKNAPQLEYALYFCPGQPWYDLPAFAARSWERIVPLIDLLVQVPEAKPYKEDLLALEQMLQDDGDACHDLLVNNAETEQAGEDTVLLRLNNPNHATMTDKVLETCFILLVFGLALAPEICYIERRASFSVGNTVAQWIGQSGQSEYRPFFEAGITGKGQVVAVSDTGLDLQNCYFVDTKEMEFGTTFDPTRRKVIQYVDYKNRFEKVDGHGTHVCGTVAGRKSLDGVTESNGFVDGVARDAQIAFIDIGADDENDSLTVPGANTLLNPGVAAGARIHSASWNSASTFYTSHDRDFDRYIYNDDSLLVVVSAGNEGPQTGTVGSPANAKNIITVGATTSAERDTQPETQNIDNLAGFSSIGPSQDLRIKPDIVAPGAYLLSAGSRSGPSCDPPSVADLPAPGRSNLDYGITSRQGTSMATPTVSGHAALVRQYFMEGWHGNGSKGSAESLDPSGTLVKAVLINGAQPLAGYDLNDIDSRQGFGRMSLIDSLPLVNENDLEAAFLDREEIGNDGKPNTYNFTLDARNKTCDDAELSVTLAWADPPGYIGCLRCVLNDLDLVVVQTVNSTGAQIMHYPNGRTDSKDDINNVERVRFKAADGDSFLLTVTASHLESSSQTYALAGVYGCLNHRRRSGAEASSQSTSSATLSRASSSRILTAVAVFQLFYWVCFLLE